MSTATWMAQRKYSLIEDNQPEDDELENAPSILILICTDNVQKCTKKKQCDSYNNYFIYIKGKKRTFILSNRLVLFNFLFQHSFLVFVNHFMW